MVILREPQATEESLESRCLASPSMTNRCAAHQNPVSHSQAPAWEPGFKGGFLFSVKGKSKINGPWQKQKTDNRKQKTQTVGWEPPTNSLDKPLLIEPQDTKGENRL
jgi:hypothetical protein